MPSGSTESAPEVAERFGLDTNLLVYVVDGRDPVRHGKARRIVDWAAGTGRCLLSVQSVGELYTVAVRKKLADPKGRAMHGRRPRDALPDRMSPTAADAQAAIAAAVAQRLSYWDALLLATLGRAGCTTVLSEDMHDGAALAGAVVRNPFAGTELPADLEALLSWQPAVWTPPGDGVSGAGPPRRSAEPPG